MLLPWLNKSVEKLLQPDSVSCLHFTCCRWNTGLKPRLYLSPVRLSLISPLEIPMNCWLLSPQLDSNRKSNLSGTVLLLCPTGCCSGNCIETCQHDGWINLVVGDCSDYSNSEVIQVSFKLKVIHNSWKLLSKKQEEQNTATEAPTRSPHLLRGCIAGGRPTPAGPPCCRSPAEQPGSGRGWPEWKPRLHTTVPLPDRRSPPRWHWPSPCCPALCRTCL